MLEKCVKAAALQAWEAGFSVIAKRLNAVLVEISPDLRIKAKPLPNEITHAEETQTLRRAESELRRLIVLMNGTYERITPWTYGYVNDKGNEQLFVRLDLGVELYDGIPDFLRTGRPNWHADHWREFIVTPIEEQAAQWRALLGKRPRISAREAENRARRALKGSPPRAKKRWTQRDLAHAIGCADGQVGKLPAWQEYAQAVSQRTLTPKAVSLTPAVLAKEGRIDPDLERLIEQQKEDYDPSPHDFSRQKRRPNRRQVLVRY